MKGSSGVVSVKLMVAEKKRMSRLRISGVFQEFFANELITLFLKD